MRLFLMRYDLLNQMGFIENLSWDLNSTQIFLKSQGSMKIGPWSKNIRPDRMQCINQPHGDAPCFQLCPLGCIKLLSRPSMPHKQLSNTTRTHTHRTLPKRKGEVHWNTLSRVRPTNIIHASTLKTTRSTRTTYTPHHFWKKLVNHWLFTMEPRVSI
jgi:hypothetical protein